MLGALNFIQKNSKTFFYYLFDILLKNLLSVQLMSYVLHLVFDLPDELRGLSPQVEIDKASLMCCDC